MTREGRSLRPLLPTLLTTLIVTAFQLLADELLTSFSNTVGQAVGYKILLLTILLLIGGLWSIALWARNSDATQAEFPVFLGEKPQSDAIVRQLGNPSAEREHHEKLLKNLSGEEKKVLLRYIEQDTKTQMFWVADGVSAGLAKKNILFVAAEVTYNNEVAHNIEEWAWEMLKEKRQYLD